MKIAVCKNFKEYVCNSKCTHYGEHKAVEARKGWEMDCTEMSYICLYRGIVCKCKEA